jgi:hypothetical protein
MGMHHTMRLLEHYRYITSQFGGIYDNLLSYFYWNKLLVLQFLFVILVVHMCALYMVIVYSDKLVKCYELKWVHQCPTFSLPCPKISLYMYVAL